MSCFHVNESIVFTFKSRLFFSQFKTANVLCDPVFSERVGPVKLPGISYSRYRRPPLDVEDLPEIDAVVISHNHYDHLDYTSVKNLHERFQENVKWYKEYILSSIQLSFTSSGFVGWTIIMNRFLLLLGLFHSV